MLLMSDFLPCCNLDEPEFIVVVIDIFALVCLVGQATLFLAPRRHFERHIHAALANWLSIAQLIPLQ